MTTQPWYPGLLQASLLDGDRAELLVGPAVGWVHDDTLLDRREPWCVVPKSQAEQGSRPEERIPAARYPHLHRAARACPLVATDGPGWRGVIDPSARHLRLEHAGTLVFDGVVDGEDVHGEQLLDRLLRELSEGVLWEDGVLLALALDVEARWPALERTFATLHGQAGTRAASARAWATELAALEQDGRLHGLGPVHRETLPAAEVGEVVLPAFSRWVLRAELAPLEWPESASTRGLRTRDRSQAGRLAVALAVISALLLAGLVASGQATSDGVRLLVVFCLAGLWLAMRAR